ADFVLLEPDLEDLRRGIVLGRTTFANSLKYVFTTTSANFGNMFSMAGASLFLPFLPLLAKQILLNNFLSDFPAMGIASDNVDEDWVEKPHRWDIRFIRDFMILFGLVSSVFDYLTFGVLLFALRATPEQFRTGWFVESLMTELFVALVVRTRRPFFQSKPSNYLLLSTLVIAVITVAIPYLPFAGILGFTPLPASVMLGLLGITALYVLATEVAKKVFYTHSAKAH
ncbi:MAG: cation transporting ATPase C-terminal domain-containing protein, partial [Chloroflexi bacterium]|nr:cation transporting ATPase C-terminal domain-containing protein [Chloroflexota bacterium]